MLTSFLLLLGTLFLVPAARPVHAQSTGVVCIIPSGGTSCPSSPASITGTVGSQLRVSVFIQNSNGLNGFDITLLANHTIIKPAGYDLTGSVLQAPQQVVLFCRGGVLVQGSTCTSTDSVDTLELAATNCLGCGITATPTTGLLFTAIYNVTAASPGTPIGFQTGSSPSCMPSSVSGTNTCVIITNGTGTPDPETVQTAICSSIIPLMSTVCIITPSDLCPRSPATVTGTVGSQLRVSVFIQNSAGLNGFDVTLLADHTVLKPAGYDLTGSVLPSPPKVVVFCRQGILVQGTTCSSTDSIDTLHLAAVGALGQITGTPTTGLLFTAIYNVTSSSSGTPLGFQTGCSNSSVSGTTTCVTVANGAPPPVPETVQTAVFASTTGSFAMSAVSLTLSLRRGSIGTSAIRLTSVNGFAGTVTLTSSISPAGAKSPSTSLSPTSVTLSAGGIGSSSLTISTGKHTGLGTYTVTVTGMSGTITQSVTITVTVTH